MSTTSSEPYGRCEPAPEAKMKPNRRKRLGILTGGGDCSGLNAVIRSTYSLGWETAAIQELGSDLGTTVRLGRGARRTGRRYRIR